MNQTIINLCEMNFSNYRYVLSGSDCMDLRRKVAVFKESTHTRSAIHLTMLTKNKLQ